jgi:hypothetical protein
MQWSGMSGLLWAAVIKPPPARSNAINMIE